MDIHEYLKEINGYDSNQKPKSIVSVAINENQYEIENCSVDVKTDDEFINMSIIFKDQHITRVWFWYQLITKNIKNIQILVIPERYNGNICLSLSLPLFYALTTNNIDEGLNEIKLLFRLSDCELYI